MLMCSVCRIRAARIRCHTCREVVCCATCIERLPEGACPNCEFVMDCYSWGTSEMSSQESTAEGAHSSEDVLRLSMPDRILLIQSAQQIINVLASARDSPRGEMERSRSREHLQSPSSEANSDLPGNSRDDASIFGSGRVCDGDSDGQLHVSSAVRSAWIGGVAAGQPMQDVAPAFVPWQHERSWLSSLSACFCCSSRLGR